MAASENQDEDVLWKNSPLYGHFKDCGLLEDVSEVADNSPCEKNSELEISQELTENLEENEKESALLASAKSFMWPNEDSLILEVKVAKAVLESELLVQEDEEFLNNFVLNEDILAEYNRHIEDKPGHLSSLLGDVVLFSGSVAAVAGAVLYLSEKAKAATAAAAILPTALAAMTSVRINSKVSQENDSQHFHQIIELLLTDMKRFKQLVRKSLNLLQGMEMISQGNFLSVDPSTGASMSTSTNNPPRCQTPLIGTQTEFPALRRAALKCTLQIIESYREAVSNLMQVSPLAGHVDMQEHYLAFVDLDSFGLKSEAEMNQPIAIRELKESAQIALVQQSEYLRRFSLAFCERVREDNVLNKAGVLKHIRDLLVKVRKINSKLSSVLEYHQAMGFDPDKVSLPLKANESKLVPLRGIYTCMFSTGLHLQHTLLKLRRLEQVFEDLDKVNKKKNSSMQVDEVKLLRWLGDFQEIQAELNACIGCLDDGVSQITTLRPEKAKVQQVKPEKVQEEPQEICEVIDDLTPSPTFDEVFEGFTLEDSFTKDTEITSELEENTRQMQKQSNRLMKELKGVLTVKAAETEIREAAALARQLRRHNDKTEDPFLYKQNGNARNGTTKGFEDSFVPDESSESSSESSECRTVRSASPKSPPPQTYQIARSVSGQLLDSDDEETTSESNDNRLVPPINSLRSLSTPDLKAVEVQSSNSYKSFAANEESSSSESDWESADELKTQPLPVKRRPLRPKNYVRLKEGQQLSLPEAKPIGFETRGGLAAEVAKMARLLRNGNGNCEEILGDSSSDSES